MNVQDPHGDPPHGDPHGDYKSDEGLDGIRRVLLTSGVSSDFNTATQQ